MFCKVVLKQMGFVYSKRNLFYIHIVLYSRDISNTEQCGLSTRNNTLNAPNSSFINVVTFIFSEDFLF